MDLARLLCAALVVSILGIVTSTGTEEPVTGGDDGGDGGDGEVIVVNTDVRCYTCDNVADNDECNGADLGENGTLTKCDFDRSNCFSIVKVNAAGDGYTAQKGCMDFEECYDRYYEMLNDPIIGGNCMRLTLFGHDPVPANEECFYCCFAFEGRSQDSCNAVMGMSFLALPDPNNWDPAVDKWEGHEPVESTVPDVTAGSEEIARPLFAVISFNMLLVSALLA